MVQTIPTTRKKNAPKKNKKKKVHKTSGYEPHNTNYKWYNDPVERMRHNCLSFAFGTRMPKNTSIGHKQQPGNLSRWGSHANLSNCQDIVNRILEDYKGKVYKLDDPYAPCKRNYTKVIFSLAPNRDFHFFRQSKDGTWRHKRGLSKVSDKDACGKKITDPFTACTDYGNGLDYSKTCTSFCRKINPWEIKKKKKTNVTKKNNTIKKKKKPASKTTTTGKKKKKQN